MVYSFLLYWSQSWTNYQLEKEFTASVESGIYLSKCASRTVDIRAMAKSNQWKSRKEYRKYFVENVIKLRFHNIIDIWIIAASTQMLIIQIPKLYLNLQANATSVLISSKRPCVKVAKSNLWQCLTIRKLNMSGERHYRKDTSFSEFSHYQLSITNSSNWK